MFSSLTLLIVFTTVMMCIGSLFSKNNGELSIRKKNFIFKNKRIHHHCLFLSQQKEYEKEMEKEYEKNNKKTKLLIKEKKSLGRNQVFDRNKLERKYYWMDRQIPTWTCPLEGN